MNAAQPSADDFLFVIIRRPTRTERRRGAEIVFVRCYLRRRETIFAARRHESWNQWGASARALAENVKLVARWRRGKLVGFPLPADATAP